MNIQARKKRQGEQCLGVVAANRKTFARPVIRLGYPPLRVHEITLHQQAVAHFDALLREHVAKYDERRLARPWSARSGEPERRPALRYLHD